MRGLALFLLLLTALPALGQEEEDYQAKIDRLLGELAQETDDSLRLKLYGQIAREYLFIDTDSTLRYAQTMRDLAERTGSLDGKAAALNARASAYWFTEQYDRAALTFDSSIRAYERADNRKALHTVHKNLYLMKYERGAYRKALPHIETCERLAVELFDSVKLQEDLLFLGSMYGYVDEADKALQTFQRYLDVSIALKDSSEIGDGYRIMGGEHKKRGQLSRATYYLEKSKQIHEAIGNQRGVGDAYYYIGSILEVQKHDEEAKNHYLKAKEYYLASGTDERMHLVDRAIADYHRRKGEYDVALPMFKALLADNIEQWRYLELTDVYIDIGLLFMDRGQTDSARLYFETGLAAARQYGFAAQEGYALTNLSELACKAKRYGQAVDYGFEAYELAKQTQELRLAKIAIGCVQAAYAGSGQYRKAYEYRNLEVKLADSLLNRAQTLTIARLESDFRFEQERQEMNVQRELLEKDNALQASSLREQNYLLLVIGSGLAIVIVVALLLYRQRELKSEANAQLASKNEEIQQQADELAAQRDVLVELDRFKQAMTGMIVHDLKNPINTVIGATAGEAGRKFRIVRQAGHQMLTLVLNMLDVQKFEETEVALDLTDMPVRDVAREAIDQVSLLAEQQNVTIFNRIPTDLGAKLDHEMTVRVFVNLLTNAIKYTPSKGQIVIGGEWHEGMARLWVQDTGAGIPQERLPRIFKKYEQVQAKKAGVARSTGLGLTFCKFAVEETGGQIWATSGEGATIWFTLPLADVHVEARRKAQDSASPIMNCRWNAEDRQRHLTALTALEQLEVYDFSDIHETLENLHPSSERVANWKEAVYNAVYSCDAERYAQLIGLAKDN